MRLVLNLDCVLPRLVISWMVEDPPSSNQGLSAMISQIFLVLSLVGLTGFGVRKTIPVTLYDATSITPECIVLSTESITTVVLEFLSAVLICTMLKHQVSKID